MSDNDALNDAVEAYLDTLANDPPPPPPPDPPLRHIPPTNHWSTQ